MPTRASPESRYGPSLVEEPSHRALGQLLLRPPRLTHHGRSSQPRTADELACGLKSLRPAPPKLGSDDPRPAQHASGTGTRTRCKADAPECIRKRAHLLVARRVGKLCLGHRFAPAHDASGAAAFNDFLRARAV